MGKRQATVNQMVKLYKLGDEQFPTDAYKDQGIYTIQDFCNLVINISNSEGVSPDVVFCQEMLETNYLKFTGVVNIHQYNFGGLGANSSTGDHGNSFKTVHEGILAQVQHLKAYASTKSLNNTCVDPRFSYVKRGSAPFVEDLSGKWAGANYGQRLRQIIDKLELL